ncbi:MAG: TlpA family protein disulfide reductase [Prevotella nanceiensis]|jgi:thiol-disulfide oxidoreductase resA|nr:TlpA family protein disulfide reductase [Hoylesella nanceiensis]MBF1440566.1 TlpA family protein disulfide reductase [Hoylesella nanceiensis]
MMKQLIMGVLMLLGLTTNAMAEDLDSLYAQSLLKVGTQAPNFELPTPEGKKVQLSDFKGKYVLIDFWASWCPDCRRISPNVEAIAKEYQGKDLAVLAVSFDIDKEAWVKYINRNGAPVNEVHVSELKKMKESAVAKAFGVQWIPSLYLLDKDGKVLLATVEVSKVEAMVKTLMK